MGTEPRCPRALANALPITPPCLSKTFLALPVLALFPFPVHLHNDDYH